MAEIKDKRLDGGSGPRCDCGVEFLQKCAIAASLNGQMIYVDDKKNNLSEESALGMIENHKNELRDNCEDKSEFENVVQAFKALIKAHFHPKS